MAIFAVVAGVLLLIQFPHAAENAARAGSGTRGDGERNRARDSSLADRVGSLLDDDVSVVPDYLREQRSLLLGRAAPWLFWAAAVLTSGLLH